MVDENELQELPITLRQSVVYLAIRVVVLQFLFAAMYLFVFAIAPLVSPTPEVKGMVYTFIGIGLIPALIYQVFETVQILLSWFTDYYTIKPTEVVHKYGIIHRKEEVYALKHVESITCDQSIVERVFNYGTVLLFNPLPFHPAERTAGRY